MQILDKTLNYLVSHGPHTDNNALNDTFTNVKSKVSRPFDLNTINTSVESIK